MPNHILNEMTIYHDPAEVMANVRGEQAIDFGVLLPLPIHYWPGNVGIDHKNVFPGTQLDAARDIWGTKWGAYGIDEDGKYQSVSERGDHLVLTFQTAWSPPMGWILAVFNTFKCSMTNIWLDEGCDRTMVDNFDHAALSDLSGEAWRRTPADDATHRRIHKLLWGVEEFTDEDA